MTAHTKFYLMSGLEADGRRYVEERQRPEHQLGDAQHFPNGLTFDWQLRPLTTHDMVEGVSYRPGTWGLARRLPHIGALYANVHLPRQYRRNTPDRVAAAYRRLLRERPELDAFNREMEALSARFAAEVAARGGTDHHDQKDHEMNRDAVA